MTTEDITPLTNIEVGKVYTTEDPAPHYEVLSIHGDTVWVKPSPRYPEEVLPRGHFTHSLENMQKYWWECSHKVITE